MNYSPEMEFQFELIEIMTESINSERCRHNIGMVKRSQKTRDYCILSILGLYETIDIKHVITKVHFPRDEL